MFLFRLSTYSTCKALFSIRQVSLHSGRLCSVFECTGHVCKLAICPNVAASISSNITFAASFDHRCVPSQVAPVSTPQVALHSGLLPSVFECMRHVCKLAVCQDVSASISSNITFAACLIIGASLRPKSSRSGFNTASRTSFWIAAISVRMHEACLQARHSSGRCCFDQQQHHFCGVF